MPQSKLTKQANFLKMAIDEAHNLIFVKDNEYRIIYANKPFLNLYPPKDRDSIIGTTTFEKFPDDEVEGFVKEDRRALNGEETEMIEDVTDFEGTTHKMLTRKIGFRGEDNEPLMLGVCSRIDKLIEKENQLAEKNAALEKFTTIAAHDLRSPLNTLISHMDLIKMDKENSLSDDSQGALAEMRKGTLLMMNQISSLLDLFKDNKSVAETCNLNLMMADVRFNLSSEIQKTGAKILNSDLPIVTAQPDLFRQLFQNLIENSIKHKIDKKPLIMIRAIKDNNGYVFEIEDNGYNIELAKDPFIVANNNSKPQRSGIGLTLCKRIVESFQGRIWVDHSYNEGCKICFSFPVDAVQQKERVYIE